MADESHGYAAVTLKSTGALIELSTDRSQRSLRIQPIDGSRQDWNWIGVFRRLLDGDASCGDELDDDAIEFLQRHLPEIEAGFLSQNRPDLLQRLADVRSQRSDEMFGPMTGSDTG